MRTTLFNELTLVRKSIAQICDDEINKQVVMPIDITLYRSIKNRNHSK